VDTPTPSPTRETPKPPSSPKKQKQKRAQLPFWRIFTRNVVLTLLSRGLLAMHFGTFNNLWYMFLSTPRIDNSHSPSSILFNGGLGLSPARIGVVLSIISAVGIVLQLLAYPPISERYGTTICYRVSLLLFPFAYFICPFIVLLPSSTPIPLPASGWMIWGGMLGVLFIHTLAKTFAMPAATILVNNCCPHPSVLSTIHGVAQSVSSGMRMLGPVLGGWGYALALNINFVAMPFWASMILSIGACFLSLAIYEGSGHEIKLEGDEEDEDFEKETTAKGDVEVGTEEAEPSIKPQTISEPAIRS
jgi:MFS family permease